MINKRLKKWIWVLGGLVLVLLAALFLFYRAILVEPPLVEDLSALNDERISLSDSSFIIGKSYLVKDSFGFWEMYLEGSPFERGVHAGKLCKELLAHQEAAFVNGIEKLVPSRSYLQFLKFFVAFYNRNLPDYIPEEYKKEIYGISFSAADEFDFIGPKYHRKLNYHGAHDIGHTLQNMGIVAGCTAVAAWGDESADGELLLGRNFDFYVGDDFARIKIIAFIKPDRGYPFAMVTWPGMIGVVSGMNMEGLTVSLNAAPSEMPGSVKTPVSILARQILQYAGSIEEAIDIASRTQTFVAENFVIGSGKENKAIIIEKTPEKTEIVEGEGGHLFCANHFQAEGLKDLSINMEARENTSTAYRQKRLKELYSRVGEVDASKLAEILRDTKGVHDEDIGLGNEMALNQLVAHHSVIFKPASLQMWVAGQPSQAGPYVLFDLKKVFSHSGPKVEAATLKGTIAADSLLFSKRYKDYEAFRTASEEIKKVIETGQTLPNSFMEEYLLLNPQHYLTYSLTGDYYYELKKWEEAAGFYETGLKKAIPWQKDRLHMEQRLSKCNKKAN